MNVLTSTEQKVAQEMINAGYTNAAQSFSGIAQQQVTIQTSTLEIATESSDQLNLAKEGDLRLVTTEIMGEMKGKSYLLLNESECEAIYQACLPPGGSAESRKVMGEAVIKEIDNIISAAVITEFSNRFQVSIFGDVPYLFDGPEAEISRIIQADFADNAETGCYLFANTYFAFENNTKLQPQFFWKLPSDFLQRIKEYAQKASAVS
uniref:CheC-like protein domain-containing protein n=1 Tax=Roseihalotalea indica TaxID=2867963 RepID=A0AA49GTY5_9BACT|nr:hypothetical protein K4G66_11180 [Tunicatimonas sp. TK19036]